MGSATPPGRLITHANAIPRVTDPLEQQGQHLDWMISELNSQLTLSPANDTSLIPYGVRLIAWGHDGSLLLSCGALASPTLCRFIPATLLVIGFSTVSITSTASLSTSTKTGQAGCYPYRRLCEPGLIDGSIFGNQQIIEGAIRPMSSLTTCSTFWKRIRTSTSIWVPESDGLVSWTVRNIEISSFAIPTESCSEPTLPTDLSTSKQW